ncbi:MAG TPA: glutamate--tRNA ligase, partial [Comamonadaceae bacterium]|nr:glutamate--tRNA ligase [Comamonadaceae bacterium]
EQGEKMSKRNGAKAVTHYRDEGYLPDAMVNYLARLGWSHGDDEIFSRAQFLEWFGLDHLGRSAGQFDEAKLRWVNAQHLKALDDAELAALVRPFVLQVGVSAEQLDQDDRLPRICALFKDRCETLVDLAGWVRLFYVDAIERNPEDAAKHLTEAPAPLLQAFAAAIATVQWDRESIAAAIKQVLKQQGAKMPQLAMPVRVLTLGTAHTPSVDAVLELLGREKILARLKSL